MYHLTEKDLLKGRRVNVMLNDIRSRLLYAAPDESSGLIEYLFTLEATVSEMDRYTVALRKYLVGDGTWVQLRKAYGLVKESLDSIVIN